MRQTQTTYCSTAWTLVAMHQYATHQQTLQVTTQQLNCACTGRSNQRHHHASTLQGPLYSSSIRTKYCAQFKVTQTFPVGAGKAFRTSMHASIVHCVIYFETRSSTTHKQTGSTHSLLQVLTAVLKCGRLKPDVRSVTRMLLQGTRHHMSTIRLGSHPLPPLPHPRPPSDA